MATIIREVSEPINRKDLNRIYKINWFLGKFLDFEFYNSNNLNAISIFLYWHSSYSTFENLGSLSYFKKRDNPILF